MNKRFYTAFASVLIIFSFMAAYFVGCSEHKRFNITNVATIDSGTIGNIPSNLTILIKKPQPYEYQIIRDCLWQLYVYEIDKGQSTLVTIVIDNSFVGDVRIFNGQIIIRPNQNGYISFDLYHYFCRLNKKKCKRIFCGEHPKPCDNED